LQRTFRSREGELAADGGEGAAEEEEGDASRGIGVPIAAAGDALYRGAPAQ